jgi:hypothetical protein
MQAGTQFDPDSPNPVVLWTLSACRRAVWPEKTLSVLPIGPTQPALKQSPSLSPAEVHPKVPSFSVLSGGRASDLTSGQSLIISGAPIS